VRDANPVSVSADPSDVVARDRTSGTPVDPVHRNFEDEHDTAV